jgi:hypothetical protein
MAAQNGYYVLLNLGDRYQFKVGMFVYLVSIIY